MATTEQPRVAQQQQQPVTRRYAKSIEEIIARFHDSTTSLEECHGLLSRLAIWCENGTRPSVEIPMAMQFLMEIGSECAPYHPSTAKHSDLRSRARIVLARNVCKLLWQLQERPGKHTACGLEAINGVTTFYAAHEDHAHFNARDRESVHAFLEEAAVDADQRIHHVDAVRALVVTGAWKAILKHQLFEAIPHLCERLAKSLGRPTPTLTDRLWRPVLCGEYPEGLADCLTQAGLTADDLIAFSEEIRRVVALCGMAVGCDPDTHADEREAGKTLLQLVSRVNHAVADLRDR